MGSEKLGNRIITLRPKFVVINKLKTPIGVAPCLLKDAESLARAAEKIADTDGSGLIDAADNSDFSRHSDVVDCNQCFFVHNFVKASVSGVAIITDDQQRVTNCFVIRCQANPKIQNDGVHGIRLRLCPPRKLVEAKQQARREAAVVARANKRLSLVRREAAALRYHLDTLMLTVKHLQINGKDENASELLDGAPSSVSVDRIEVGEQSKLSHEIVSKMLRPRAIKNKTSSLTFLLGVIRSHSRAKPPPLPPPAATATRLITRLMCHANFA